MAAAELFANTPATVVSSGGTDSPVSGTVETWTVAAPGAFPAAATGVTQFHVGDPAATSEMLAVTNVSGSTWTVTRGAEGTTPVAHSAGFTVQQVATAGVLGSFAQAGQGDLGGSGASPQVTSVHLGSALSLAQGGSGAGTQQGAINSLTGAQAAGRYLRSDGTNASLSVIIAADVPVLNQNTSGTAAAVSGTVAIISGGTGAGTQQGALNSLAGGVTAGQYLRGNGTNVSLAVIQAADLPAATTSAQGAVRFDGTAADIQPLGVQAAGASGLGADAKHIHPYQPWQFLPETYGAKGDGRIVGDGAMTAPGATLTSATANFTSGDVGKNIVVNGALGSSNAPLYTTIASFTNSTTVTLNASATNTVTAAAAFWASDDSAAIVSAITAASTWAQANTWKAQVIFSDKFYGLATLTTTAAGGALAQQNALVPIPYPNVNGTTQKLCIEFAGVGESADEQYFGATIPSLTGTALVATVAATGTTPSIIGGPSASTNLTGTWANVKFTARGITVWAGFNPGWVGWDLRQLASCWVDNAAAQVLAPAGGGQNPGLGIIPANTSGWGVIFPSNNDNGAGRLMVEGYYQGVGLAPRTTIEKLFTESNGIAVFAKTVNSTVTHGARIGYWSVQTCTTAIGSVGTSGTMPLVIDLYDSAGTITTDLSDAHGTLVGNMNWWHTVSTSPTVVAGFAMRIVNLRVNPGPVSSPASPPSSGSPSTAIFRDTEVTLSLTGGSLTALLIDSVDQHIPAGCVLWKFTLPSGHTYTPTYTGVLATDVAVM